MTGARTSMLATLRGRIERIETPGDAHALTGWRSGMRMPMRRCTAASHWPRCMRCSPKDSKAPRRPVLSRALRDGSRRAGRWSGCGRTFPKLNPARCR